jgi:hypothetical protein
MSLAETLIDLLEQSRESFVTQDAGQRLLAATDDEARAAAICTEIGQTMLPRCLTFRDMKGTELVVDAGGRRLMKIISFAPDTLAQPTTELMSERRDEALVNAQTKAIGTLIAAFSRAASGDFAVASGPPDGKYLAGAIGFVPEKLHAACVEALKEIVPTPAKVAASALADSAPQPPPPVAASPALEPAKRVDPTSAMRELIRQKTAASGKGNPEPAPRAGLSPDEITLNTFFDSVKGQVALCAILNKDGNVESVGGIDPIDGILELADEFTLDFTRWVEMTTSVLSRTQLIILRAGGIQNYSICCLTNTAGMALVVFLNTDLSRVFGLAERHIAIRPV